MTNLLPEKAQRVVWSGVRARFVMTGALLMIAAAGLAVLALAPTYAVFAFASAASAAPSVSRPALDPSDVTNIAHTQGLVSQLLPLVSATTSPTDAITLALSKLSRGVKVDHITYTPGHPTSLMLVGTADTREAINAYRDALLTDKHFGSVTVPVGALVGADGGRFTVTLTGAF